MGQYTKGDVFVVDDDPFIIKLLAGALIKEGYGVVTAESGEAALKMISQSIQCQIFFIDLQLPGINGLELCKIIRHDFMVANIFAITAHHSYFDLVACREAGFDDYFKKPLDLELLLSITGVASQRLHRWKSL